MPNKRSIIETHFCFFGWHVFLLDGEVIADVDGLRQDGKLDQVALTQHGKSTADGTDGVAATRSALHYEFTCIDAILVGVLMHIFDGSNDTVGHFFRSGQSARNAVLGTCQHVHRVEDHSIKFGGLEASKWLVEVN